MNQMQEKLGVAARLNIAQLNQATVGRELEIKKALEATAKVTDPLSHAKGLIQALGTTTNYEVLSPIREAIAVDTMLTEFLAWSAGGKPLEYEFFTDRDSYTGENNGNEPIDTSKLIGANGLLVSILTAAGVTLEWPPRVNGLKAKLIIKG